MNVRVPRHPRPLGALLVNLPRPRQRSWTARLRAVPWQERLRAAGSAARPGWQRLLRALRSRPHPSRRRLQAAAAVLLATAGTFLLVRMSSPAHAENASYLRGPAPTAAELTGPRGPLPTAAQVVPAWAVSGFAGGTLYYPAGTGQTYGGVAMIPGYDTPEAALDWLGPRVASEGFVVLTVAPLHLGDFPDQRSTELLAALDYLVHRSPVRAEVDPNRLAVLGHSMGGGGSLLAASRASAAGLPRLKAAVAIDPWDPAAAWPGDGTPTLILTTQGDTIAPTATMAEPDYATIPATAEKAFLELRGGNHFTLFLPNPYTVEYTVSWLKRFVDNDPRYAPFLCPGPVADPAVAVYQATCPLEPR